MGLRGADTKPITAPASELNESQALIRSRLAYARFD